jgi:hypothetical protein
MDGRRFKTRRPQTVHPLGEAIAPDDDDGHIQPRATGAPDIARHRLACREMLAFEIARDLLFEGEGKTACDLGCRHPRQARDRR